MNEICYNVAVHGRAGKKLYTLYEESKKVNGEAMMRKLFFILTLFVVSLVLSGMLSAETNDEYSEALKYYTKGNYKEAVRHFQNHVETKPEPAAYYLLGYSLYKLGKFDEAAENFREAYTIDPEFSPQQLDFFKKQPKSEASDIEKLSGHPMAKGNAPAEVSSAPEKGPEDNRPEKEVPADVKTPAQAEPEKTDPGKN